MATRRAKGPGAAAKNQAAERRSARLQDLRSGLRKTLWFTPVVWLGVVHHAFDGLLRRASVVIPEGAEYDADGNGVIRVRGRVDLNEYADSVLALVPGDVYLDFEERTDCAPPEHTRINVVATDAAALDRITALLVEEMAVHGCSLVLR